MSLRCLSDPYFGAVCCFRGLICCQVCHYQRAANQNGHHLGFIQAIIASGAGFVGKCISDNLCDDLFTDFGFLILTQDRRLIIHREFFGVLTHNPSHRHVIHNIANVTESRSLSMAYSVRHELNARFMYERFDTNTAIL